MKDTLPPIALEVFAVMTGRAPSEADEQRLRRLHDALGAGDSRAAWWDVVHKFHLERMIRQGFAGRRYDASADLAPLRQRLGTLPTTEQVRRFVADTMLDRMLWAGGALLVGIVLGGLFHAVFVR